MLKGKVAVVTGASRGAGRGIAQVLGEAGATVYVTGRSVRGATTKGWPETIEETAELVTARGGRGIPVRCDHTVDADVTALFEQVKREQGGLDMLVNNAWGGYEDLSGFKSPFWEQPDRWPGMFTAGVRAHLQASRLAAPLLLKRGPGGLIVNTTFYDRGKALSNIYYDLAKQSINRMAYYMALDLASHGIAAVALSPGWMRTERVMDSNPSPEELERTESVEYIGRAVLALATDPQVMAKSGRTLTVGDLAAEYGFTDVDGRRVPPFLLRTADLKD